MPSGSFNICCSRDCVSRHNGGTSGAPLKPLRDDSALRALLTLRGLRGAPEEPPLCRETQSLGQQMLNAPVGINDQPKKNKGKTDCKENIDQLFGRPLGVMGTPWNLPYITALSYRSIQSGPQLNTRYAEKIGKPYKPRSAIFGRVFPVYFWFPVTVEFSSSHSLLCKWIKISLTVYKRLNFKS